MITKESELLDIAKAIKTTKPVMIEIHYDAKCKHCRNFQGNGRGKKTTCALKHQMIFGEKTKACDDFKL